MGTTLTGTTPQDTYDSLIKVTNNGPLSSTARYLSDGLGNDSVLALSTSAAGVGTTTMARKFNIDGGSITSDTPTLRISSTDGSGTRKFGIEFYSNSGADVRGKLLADNSGKVYLDDNGGGGVVLQANGGTGNVGIGTSSPSYKLQADITDATVYSSANTLTASPIFWVNNNSTTAGTAATIRLDGGALNGNAAATISSVHVGNGSSALTFGTRNLNSNITERVRILAEGGITFNGDTAAANALDDYEEGTWTPNFTLNAGSVSAYTSSGSYTKIGRQVSVTLSLVFTTTSSAQVDTITGLPFTAENTAQTAIGAVRENSNTGDMWHWRVSPNATSGVLRRYDNNIALANGDSFIGTLTYFV